MTRILVAYTTNAGSTTEVAEAVATELGKDGAQVDLVRLEQVTSLEGYHAVVIGAPMILGWHRAAQKFVKTHRAVLASVPAAYFCTAMSLTQTTGSPSGAPPLFIDPWLAKAPKNPARLSYKENYAAPASYLKPILKAAPAVKPVSIAFFGGKLEMFRLKLLQALFVMVIIQAQPGDLRNWSAIQEWAASLRPLFAARGVVV